ncbi:hypothetical protein ACIOTI_34725 [Streptomyces sp. NPDC087843]|uniref:hypothetical protein n=1 Tax=Streptomyces sp. NPDC087843 TaxID=3365804 RepID=UPI0038103077
MLPGGEGADEGDRAGDADGTGEGERDDRTAGAETPAGASPRVGFWRGWRERRVHRRNRRTSPHARTGVHAGVYVRPYARVCEQAAVVYEGAAVVYEHAAVVYEHAAVMYEGAGVRGRAGVVVQG